MHIFQTYFLRDVLIKKSDQFGLYLVKKYIPGDLIFISNHQEPL